MANSFLPDKDAALLLWAQNFYSVANSAPTSVGLTSSLCTAFNALVTAYQTALQACDPGTRNKASVATKNSAKASLKINARFLAKLVAGTASVTDAQKLELGLNVKATPTSIPAPAFAPAVDVESVLGHTVNVLIHDSQELRRGRPSGCQGAVLYSFVGAEAPTDPSAWTNEGITTKVRRSIEFPSSVAAGAQVWITAQWYSPTADTGPAATPATAYLQLGSSMAA